VTNYARFACSAARLFIDSGWTYSPSSWHWKALAEQWRDRSQTTSWAQTDEGVIDEYNRDEDRVGTHVDAMLHLCCTTQLQPLWSAAIAAIMTEVRVSEDNSLSLTRWIPEVVYWKEVWWPVLGHILLFTEKELELPISVVLKTSSTFSRLSSPMKDRWLSFLMHSKTRVSQSNSLPVVVSYLLCCLAIIESTTSGPYMRAFMEVLKAQYGNLQESQLEDLLRCLLWCDWRIGLLLCSLSGLSFPVQIALSLNARYRHQVR
jgi:hypothetical protein